MYVTMRPYRDCQWLKTFYPTQVFSVRYEVNRATAPQRASANFSTRAVSILLFPHTSCISLSTILWNVNFIMCTWSLSYPPWYSPVWNRSKVLHLQPMLDLPYYVRLAIYKFPAVWTWWWQHVRIDDSSPMYKHRPADIKDQFNTCICICSYLPQVLCSIDIHVDVQPPGINVQVRM